MTAKYHQGMTAKYHRNDGQISNHLKRFQVHTVKLAGRGGLGRNRVLETRPEWRGVAMQYARNAVSYLAICRIRVLSLWAKIIQR